MTPTARREWLETFIELYKSEPCLWKTKSTEYYDRNKKDAAYEKLIKKLKEIEPAATRESVIKKINNIRCTYKKEYNKVVASIASLNNSVYEPRLWYYSLLSFLDSHEAQKITRSDSENTNESIQKLYTSFGSVRDTEQKVKEVDSDLKHLVLNESGESTDTFISSEDFFSWPQVYTAGPSSDQFVTPQQFVPVKEERSDIMGKLVALKLRDLPKEQELLAEKLINEVLFEAEQGRLTTEHRVQRETESSSYCLCNSLLLDVPVPVLEYSNMSSNCSFDNTKNGC